MISIVTLAGVMVLIALRRIGGFRVAIWQAMVLGALIVVLTGSIEPIEAVGAIRAEVMLFLFGVFVIGRALAAGGAVAEVAQRILRQVRSMDGIVLVVLFGAGVSSALLMNDTLAIIGTPLVILLSRSRAVPATPLLMALCFAVTIGSIPSPIGNPQNLLIASSGGFQDPFWNFLAFLGIPALINMGLAFVLLRLYYVSSFRSPRLSSTSPPEARDPALSRLSIAALLLFCLLIGIRILVGEVLSLPTIALMGAAPILLFSGRRLEILRTIDWPTLLFFAAMFVLMESVWRTGFFETMAQGRIDLASVPLILGFTITLSQIVSNVPLVALILPLLGGADTAGWMAAAAGSTIAGNLTVLGAASNVIVIQQAEQMGETISWWEFARIGIPLTAANALVTWVWLIC